MSCACGRVRALALSGALTIVAASGGLAQDPPSAGAPGDDSDCLIVVARGALDHPAWRDRRTVRPEARLDQAGLRVLVEQLHRSYTVHVSARNPLPPHEVIVAFDSWGDVRALNRGTARRVDVDAAFAPLLAQPGAGLILVHNHPAGGGLSLCDLLALGGPGVAAIAAVGHDGSVYAASAGARMNVATLRTWEYQRARDSILRELGALSPIRSFNRSALVLQADHLVAMGLARAGVVLYEARLSFSRQVSINQATPWPARMTRLAAEDLRRTPRR